VIVVEQPAAFSDYADEEGGAGPTIFDRRGRRERVVSPAPEPAPEPAPAVSEPLEVTDQPETVLIFRDGHRVELRNYAIVGDTLYDFTSARHKISLADLDLTATARENDDRGIDFHVPATAGGSQQ
jgi:phosphoglycolate phosphatase-like HAD superfamily hydrolase